MTLPYGDPKMGTRINLWVVVGIDHTREQVWVMSAHRSEMCALLAQGEWMDDQHLHGGLMWFEVQKCEVE